MNTGETNERARVLQLFADSSRADGDLLQRRRQLVDADPNVAIVDPLEATEVRQIVNRRAQSLEVLEADVGRIVGALVTFIVRVCLSCHLARVRERPTAA